MTEFALEKLISLPRAQKIGRWWFQYRSFSPLPLFLLMLVLSPEIYWSGVDYFLIFLPILLGEALRIWAVGYAGSVTRTRGDAVPKLVMAGPYRHVRNPLYIGNILLYVGCSFAFGFFWLSLVMFFYFFIQYSFIIRYEEGNLKQIFGLEYVRYCEKVPRWAGVWVAPVAATPEAFDLRRALRSERSTLIAMGAMVVLFVALRVF